MTETQRNLIRENLLTQAQAATDLIRRSIGEERLQAYLVREKIYEELDELYSRRPVLGVVANGLIADMNFPRPMGVVEAEGGA